MLLRPSSTFGHFEIIGLIGAGAMGEVYRGRDTRLERDVALKVLPAAFSSDPDRLARFEREAKALAALNHPHIAHVYGLEHDSSHQTRALVMELVEGEDLAQRIARGPIGTASAISIVRQLASAIASAHEHGIIHRDLKPSNIRVTPDGVVKVLDFGLAKALLSSAVDAGSAATVTAAGTVVGTILGTPGYLSPEQARGQPVDTRTDVWAFGCIVYEMITGHRAFAGDTVSDTIARILEREPDWGALPASTPPGLRRLVTQCLEKDPKRRLHAIADGRFDIDAALSEDASTTVSPVRRARARIARRPLVAAAVVGAALVSAVTAGLFKRSGNELPPARIAVLTSSPGREARPTFSPDGSQVAFSWDGETQDNEDIYVVVVGSDSSHRVTTNPARDVSPAWKPDASEIAFARLEADRAVIYVASPLGQSERKLAEFSALPVQTGPRDMNDPFLVWSPDGRWLAVSHKTASDEGVFLLANDGSAQRLLIARPRNQDYVPLAFSPDGTMLAYVDSGQILLAEIDPTNSPVVTKPPRQLTRYLGSINGLTWTADSKEVVFGRSLYAAPTPSHLWRVPAAGNREPERFDLAGVASSPTLSSSAHRLAFSRRDLNVDMMKIRETGELDTLAASTFHEFDASFSPDGTKVAFASDRTGEGNEIWVANADGTGRRPVTKGTRKPEGSPRWSPDGQWLAYDALGDDGQRHVYVIDQAGGPSRALPSKVGFYDQLPSWSRDGKWIYFGSNRSGTEQVWRVPAEGGSAGQVTTAGGGVPFESWDGRTLYYSRSTSGGRLVLAMPAAGGPERALDVSVVFWNYRPTERGLYYASLPIGHKPPYTYEVRLLDNTGNSRALFAVRLASMSPGLSVAPDGTTVLISGVATVGQDLYRIENFR
jgi:serine/threonine protein kinase